MTTNDEQVVDAYFRAMRRGAAAADELFELFTADAEYVEPFSGLGPAVGLARIRERFETMWQQPLPDMELDVLGLTIDGGAATVDWECRSPALPGPQRGRDHYRLADGRIARLEVTLLDDER